jgi:hypothetical protein
MRDTLLLGKLKYQGCLNAVVPGDLLYVIDSISKRRYLVDTGASFSVLSFFSTTAPTGPRLSGPGGANIPCWGYKRDFLVFGLRRFVWRFLLAAVKFPIIGVDFLRHFKLLLDPAGQQLVDSASRESITATEAAVAPSTAATAMQVATCGDFLQPAEKQEDWPSSAATAVQVATCCNTMRLAVKQVDEAAAVTKGGPNGLQQRLAKSFPDVFNSSKVLPVATHGVEAGPAQRSYSGQSPCCRQS